MRGPFWVHPRLVAIEGPACSYKSTLADLLRIRLIEGGYTVKLVRLSRRSRRVKRLMERSIGDCNLLQVNFRYLIVNYAAPAVLSAPQDIILAERWVASHLLYSSSVIGEPGEGFWSRVPQPVLWILVRNTSEGRDACAIERLPCCCNWPEAYGYDRAFERLELIVKELASYTNSRVEIVEAGSIEDLPSIADKLLLSIRNAVEYIESTRVRYRGG